MPQGPVELHEKWGSDAAALDYLRANFVNDRGLIRPRHGNKPTDEEWSAIQYLCYEWDYGWLPQATA